MVFYTCQCFATGDHLWMATSTMCTVSPTRTAKQCGVQNLYPSVRHLLVTKPASAVVVEKERCQGNNIDPGKTRRTGHVLLLIPRGNQSRMRQGNHKGVPTKCQLIQFLPHSLSQLQKAHEGITPQRINTAPKATRA